MELLTSRQKPVANRQSAVTLTLHSKIKMEVKINQSVNLSIRCHLHKRKVGHFEYPTLYLFPVLHSNRLIFVDPWCYPPTCIFVNLSLEFLGWINPSSMVFIIMICIFNVTEIFCLFFLLFYFRRQLSVYSQPLRAMCIWLFVFPFIYVRFFCVSHIARSLIVLYKLFVVRVFAPYDSVV